MNKDKYLGAIDRLNTILSLFQAKRARYSISDIATMLNVPPGVVRDDIVALHTSREFPVSFYPCDDDLADEIEDDFIEKIKSGDIDDEELEVTSSERDDMYLALSSLEYKCLNELLSNNENWALGTHRNFVTKPLYNQSKSSMQVKASEMQKVIEDGESIRIRYCTKNKDIIALDIRPLQLVHIEDEDLYYVVTIYNGNISPFRLDRIKGFDVLETEIEKPDLSPLSDLPNMWGMGVSERAHVKILIRNEGRVQEKVKADLKNRTNGQWTKKGSCLIFEDDVIGIGSFKNWLNGYGSSVLVLEPESLREEVIKSAQVRLEKYRKEVKAE